MLIGLTGYIGSGKTLAARHLVTRHGFVSLNFKDALDDELIRFFPDLLTEILSYYSNSDIRTIVDLLRYKPTLPLIRALKQNFGTDVRRFEDPNYWCLRWVDAWERISKGESVVVDDVRFLNEARFLRSRGGVIVKIARGGDFPSTDHASESEIAHVPVQMIISNRTNDRQDLFTSMDKLVEECRQSGI